MTAAEVYLPCDVGHVRIKLGFGDTLSPLEETALRVIAALSPPSEPAAVAAGMPAGPGGAQDAPPPADIGTVAKLLGLGHRVVLDLVHDLWRAGYLVVDFGTNAIWPSQDVLDKLVSGELARLQGAETEDCAVELMVERLTGHVMHSEGPRAPADPRFAIRFLGTDTGLAEAAHADIHQAVRDWLRREQKGRQRRIMSIRSAPRDRSTDSRRRWYQLGVQADLNPDTDDLVVTVTDRRFPADRRDVASDRLTRLAQERPLEPWVIGLRSAAAQKLVTPQPVEAAIGQLAARIAGGLSVPPGMRRATHEEWAYESGRIATLIGDRAHHEAEVAAVFGGEAHAAAISQLIDEASVQLVLVSPRVVDHVLERFRPRLRAAIDRGVQVVILWGAGHKATLNSNVRNALDSLARRARTAPMLRPQVSANTDARMVICDNRAALVTSRDLLSTTGERPEIGILLRRPEGQSGAVVSELLGWARATTPGVMSTSVLRTADHFDGTRVADLTQPAGQPAERLPEEPPEDADEDGAVQAWVMRWESHLAAQRAELVRRPLPAVRLVEDGAHRELLWQALRRAERRLVIASGQLSDEVMNSRMIDAITMRLAQGVAVTIGYDEHAGTDRGSGGLAALADLAETYPTLLTVSGGVGHARALVRDDEVTVGSYSYLFHAGYGTVGGRHMLPSELSVRLTDPALADQVAAACGEPAEVSARVSGRAAEPVAPAPPVDQGALTVAQRILNRAGDPRSGEFVRAELRTAPDPWPVLDLLDRLAAPAVRRAAMAYCLAYAGPDAPTAARWRDRLVFELARAGLFTEAQILRAGTAGQGTFPRAPDLAVGGAASAQQALRPKVLAALSRRGLSGGDVLLEAAFEDDLTADERAALRAVCVAELLDSGSTDADNALDVLTSGDGPWGELARLAVSYHQHAAGVSTAELMHEISRQQRVDTWLDGAWDRLEIALIEAEPLPKALDGARKTKAALYKDTGILGRLRAMTARRDLTALRTLVTAEFPARPRDAEVAGDLLDRTWRAVAPLSELLDGRPRAKYIKRLAEVVSAARDLAVAGQPADVTADAGSAGGSPGASADGAVAPRHPDLLAAAGELAEGYRRLRPALEDPGDAGPLAIAAAGDALASLDRLMSGLPSERETAADADGGEPLPHAAESAATGGELELAVVPLWPGQWLYPELAAALWAGEADPAAASDFLLRDLVDPLPPAQTARRLIRSGEFAAVEALRSQVTLGSHDDAALLRELQAAQASAGARARYEATALTRRARRTDLAASLDADVVSDQAQRRRAVAETTLDEFRDKVEAAESELARVLVAAVEEHPAVQAGRDETTGADAEAIDRWQRTVLACVNAREFPIARHLLDQGPGEAFIHDSRVFAPPRPVWPFPADAAETVVAWYFADEHEPAVPARFRAWRPAAQDSAAWELLETIRAHLLEPSSGSASLLRDKLQGLVGATHRAGPMDERAQSWSGRLYLPDSHRLPRLSFLGRDGIALWVADSGTPPHGLDDAVVVWLVTDFGRVGEAHAGTAIIDLPFLFRLLAPEGNGTADAEARLVNLARQLGAQLDARLLIGDAQPPFMPVSETEVAWLLDLLGASTDGVVADALRFDTGGRREVLVPLLGELLPPPAAGRGRNVQLDPPAVNLAWDAGAWRPAALGDLLAPLRGESAALTAALALAWVVAAFHDGSFALDDLPTGIRLAAVTEKQAEAFLRSVDLGEAARQLLRVGLLERADQDRWRLPENGIRELLAGVWPEHDPVARARETLAAWFGHHERAAAQSRAELSDRVVRTIGHRLANMLAGVRSAADRNDPEHAWRILARVGSVHEQYQEALSGEEVLSLWDILLDRKSETEFIQPALRVTLHADADTGGLYVIANDWLLGQAFQNLFDNARQAFEATGREFGEARVSVAVQASSDGAEPRCRIDIADSGTGMDAKVRARFAAGEEQSTWGGRGTGLKTARAWFEEYRGGLEIMNGPSALGGAWVRVTLPLTAAPGAAEAGDPGAGGSV